MLKTFLLGLLIFISLTGLAQNQKIIDWRGDIEYLKTELPLRHKDLFFQMTKDDYEGRLDYLSSHLSSFSDLEIAIKLQQLIAKIGDSHTSAGYTKFFDEEKILPLQLYWFSDGLYITQTAKDYEKILGSKITKINDFGIQSVADSLSTLITIDNNALVKSRIPGMIPFLQLLEYFGFSKSNLVKIEAESGQGQSNKFEIKAGKTDRNNIISFVPDSLAFCWKNQRSIFIDKYFENEAIYYLQYNRCTSREIAEQQGNQNNVSSLPSFADFENRVFYVIRNKQINKLIFDMRFNGGGNSNQGTQFISKLSDFNISKQDRKLYVIIGRQTFSSAIINTLDFKKQTKAILVGEETGGKPNHFGEIRNFQLPSSGLIITYSTKYFTETKEDLNTIAPDVIIETSFSDFKKGIDPVYEWIKNQ